MNKLEEILNRDEELYQDIIDGKLSYGTARTFIESWMEEAYQLGRINTANWIKDKQEYLRREDGYYVDVWDVDLAITTKDLDI